MISAVTSGAYVLTVDGGAEEGQVSEKKKTDFKVFKVLTNVNQLQNVEVRSPDDV